MPSAQFLLLRSVSRPTRAAGQHDAEQEQDHHRADVHEHLGDGDELGGQQQVLRGGAGHRRDQRQRGVHDVAAAHDVDGATTIMIAAMMPKPMFWATLRSVAAKHHFLPFLSAPASSSGASGTVSIHSPSLSLSCSRSAMRRLAVLVLGAPEQGVERAHLDADAAVHAQRVVDVEAVDLVDLARRTAGTARRGQLLVALDVDAPVGAATRAQHARRCSCPRARR